MRLSYSGIFGSKLAASSPKRFAGICALLRLWVPRSPPFAFIPLTFLSKCLKYTLKINPPFSFLLSKKEEKKKVGKL